MKYFLIGLAIFLFLIILAGGIFVAVGYFNVDKNVVSNTYDIEDIYNNIDIDVSVTNVELVLVDDQKSRIEFEEREKYYHEAKVENGTLIIKSIDKRAWYEKIFTPAMKATLYLNRIRLENIDVESSTGDFTIDKGFSIMNLNIDLSTGNVSVKSNVYEKTKVVSSTGNVSFFDMYTKELKISASTGNVNLTNIELEEDLKVKISTGNIVLNEINASGDITLETSSGKISLVKTTSANLDLKASTGNVTLIDIIIEDHMEINTSTGNIKLENSDAETIEIKTSTGNITGTILTDKVFYAMSNTGIIDVPLSTQGGLCKIDTDTGNIKIQFSE